MSTTTCEGEKGVLAVSGERRRYFLLWKMTYGFIIGNHLFKSYGKKFKVRPVNIFESFSPNPVRR